MQPGYSDPNAMMNTWMYHPGGYASLTGQTGVTYFVAPTNQIPQFVSTFCKKGSAHDPKNENFRKFLDEFHYLTVRVKLLWGF